MFHHRIRKRRQSKRNGRVERLMARVRKRREKQIAWLLIFSSEGSLIRAQGGRKKKSEV